MIPIHWVTWEELRANGDEDEEEWILNEAADLMSAVDDNVARALDLNGWMIVPVPGGPADDGRKWPVSPTEGYVPEWAKLPGPAA